MPSCRDNIALGLLLPPSLLLCLPNGAGDGCDEGPGVLLPVGYPSFLFERTGFLSMNLIGREDVWSRSFSVGP